MSEPLTMAGIAIVVISNVGIWIDKIKAGRGNGKVDKEQKELCLDHQKRIGGLEAEHRNFETFRKENREDHRKIFDEIHKRKR